MSSFSQSRSSSQRPPSIFPLKVRHRQPRQNLRKATRSKRPSSSPDKMTMSTRENQSQPLFKSLQEAPSSLYLHKVSPYLGDSTWSADRRATETLTCRARTFRLFKETYHRPEDIRTKLLINLRKLLQDSRTVNISQSTSKGRKTKMMLTIAGLTTTALVNTVSRCPRTRSPSLSALRMIPAMAQLTGAASRSTRGLQTLALSEGGRCLPILSSLTLLISKSSKSILE